MEPFRFIFLVAAAVTSTGTPAFAERQCVKNAFGTLIVAKVRWYKPEQVIQQADKKIRIDGKPVKTEKLAVLQTSCITNEKRMFAVVSVVGGKIATASIKIAVNSVMVVGGAVACVGTAGIGCPAAVGVAGVVVGELSSNVPDAKEVFYMGSPGMLEV